MSEQEGTTTMEDYLPPEEDFDNRNTHD